MSSLFLIIKSEIITKVIISEFASTAVSVATATAASKATAASSEAAAVAVIIEGLPRSSLHKRTHWSSDLVGLYATVLRNGCILDRFAFLKNTIETIG
jgi:hypothetical protein